MLHKVHTSTLEYTELHQSTSLTTEQKQDKIIKFHKLRACGIKTIKKKNVANSGSLIWLSVPPTYHLGVILFLLIFP